MIFYFAKILPYFRMEIFLAAYIPFFFCFLQLGDLLNMVFLGSAVRPLYDNGLSLKVRRLLSGRRRV